MKPERAKITLTLDEAMRRNLFLFNNPVLIQGLALTPVVAAAVSLKVALILSIVAFVLIIPTRILGDLLIGIVPKNLRPLVYAVISSACFIPAFMLVMFLFGADARGPENFIALLVVDGIVLSRSEIQAREGIGKSLKNGFLTALGCTLVLVLVGSIREILAEGKILGFAIAKSGAFPIASTIAGGFIIVALLSALLQWAGAMYKRAAVGGAKTEDD